jgi:hypothetical protein
MTKTPNEHLDHKAKSKGDEFSDEEIARRRDELAKHMLNTPPRPLKPKSKDGAKANPPRKHRRPKKENGAQDR